MSILGLLCLLLALIAAMILVLYGLQRRELRRIGQLSQQLLRIAAGGPIPEQLEHGSDKADIAGLVTAVNHLLTRARGGAERDAAQAPRLFTDLGDRIHEAVLLHREVILYANRQFASLVGVDRVELIGRRLADLVPPEYAELVSENIRRRLTGEPAAERYEIEMVGMQGQVSRLEISSTPVDFRPGRALLLSRTNGSERSIELSASPIRNSAQELLGAVVLLHDVTEMRGLARQMSYQATHDALTGLVNRREFERRLAEAIESGHRGDGQHVLCYLDLDRFKLVNDTSGHLAGDSMLREVAKLLRDAVRDSDKIGRLGGDEFGTLLIGCPLDKARPIAPDLTPPGGAGRVAQA